ncbi:uncharacterized protein [Amphiura filiformis]|uniref:uncharacterized protein n=1 Tax=Amphiura filiformis TaxID=82378 RepID=UPI003B221F1C
MVLFLFLIAISITPSLQQSKTGICSNKSIPESLKTACEDYFNRQNNDNGSTRGPVVATPQMRKREKEDVDDDSFDGVPQRRPMADPPRFGKRANRRPVADPPRFGKRVEHVERRPISDLYMLEKRGDRRPIADPPRFGKRSRRPIADPPRFGKRGERRPLADPPRFGKRDGVSQELEWRT